MTDKAPGIIPKIWGPHAWILLHSITFSYLENPVEQEREAYKIYFEKLAEVLPCSECRESYKQFISDGITKLDNDVLKNRYSLTKWMYDIHNAVNNKLGVSYDVSYDDVVKKYESFRATCPTQIDEKGSAASPGQCFAPESKKALSYRAENTKECIVIPLKIARHFIKYAQMRNLGADEFMIINNIKKDCKEDHDIWIKRNEQCTEIFKDIHMNDKPTIETSGPYEGLPTIDELKLILRFSTSLDKSKLIEIIKKLGEKFPQCKCEYKIFYKLTK